MHKDGVPVTSLNYRDLYAEYSLDIHDEVRSALFDEVDIFAYIEQCKEDPERLHQIRLALKAGVPKRYWSLRSWEVLKKVRQLIQAGVNLQEFDEYLGLNLPSTHYLALLTVIQSGYSVISYDFGTIPDNLIAAFQRGILSSKPMFLFNDQYPRTEEDLEVLLTLAQQNKNIYPVLQGFSTNKLKSLLKTKNSTNFDLVVKHLTGQDSDDFVATLVDAQVAGLPVDVLGALNSDGDHVYETYHLDWVLQAFEAGLDWETLLRPDMSNFDLSVQVREMQLQRGARLTGRLSKRFKTGK